MFAVLFAECYNFDEYPTPYSGGRGKVKTFEDFMILLLTNRCCVVINLDFLFQTK